MLGVLALKFKKENLVNMRLYLHKFVDITGGIVRGRIKKKLTAINAAIIEVGDNNLAFLADLDKLTNHNTKKYYFFVYTRPKIGNKMAVVKNINDLNYDEKNYSEIIKKPPEIYEVIYKDFCKNCNIKAIITNDREIANKFRGYSVLDNIIEVIPSNESVIKDRDMRSYIYSSFESDIYTQGLSLNFTSTPALVAIDIDASFDSHLKINMMSIKIILEQIKFRNLSGSIVIDFITLNSNKEREVLIRSLRDSCKKDKGIFRVSNVSKSGLVEISRKRNGYSLHDYSALDLASFYALDEIILHSKIIKSNNIIFYGNSKLCKFLKNKQLNFFKNIIYEDNNQEDYFNFEIN